MSDERLREAERRWRETGSVEDEAKYLLERVRVGDLTRERLELAAYCGHEGARRVAGVSPVPCPESEFVDGLLRHSADLARGVVIAAVRAAFHSMHPWVPQDPRPASLLRAAEEWASSPSEDCRRAFEDRSLALNGLTVSSEQARNAVEALTWVIDAPAHSLRSAADAVGWAEVMRAIAQWATQSTSRHGDQVL